MVTQQEAEAYLAELEKEAVRVVKGIHNVRIIGAVGAKHAIINGVYKPTEELCDNAIDYVRVDDSNRWLEYNASLNQWQVKPTSGKGKSGCYAYCPVSPKCLPQDCPEGFWRVHDSADKWETQSLLAIAVVTHAEADAFLAEVEREAARVVKGSQHVRIFGAFGVVDGIYKPTAEMWDNVTVNVKVDDDDTICLEYHAAKKQWQVKDTACKGKDGCYAFCAAYAKCLPEECPKGQWYLPRDVATSDAVTMFNPQPIVIISVVTQEEADAHPA